MNDTMTNLQNWNRAVDVENKHNSVALFFSLVRSVELADRLGVDNGVSIVTMFTRSPTLSLSFGFGILEYSVAVDFAQPLS